jgi:UDP-N-acetylmuramoyl-L-alanyl-D-glutamate--2,6-diaminopimelate ligase
MMAADDLSRASGAGAADGEASIAQLFAGIVAVPRDLAVADITLDSREVVPGGLFLACRGINSHGLDYLQQAIATGVAALAWEPAPGIAEPRLPESVVGVRVPDLSRHLGLIADRFFASPSARLRIAGITGTNGKTTSAWLLAQALSAAGRRSAYAGTLGYGPVQGLRPSRHTTPDCVTVHRQLHELATGGVRWLGMEVSSHALAQDRIDGVRFHTAVFTNLSRDHLDYHRTMEAYGEAKARLFARPEVEQRVINMGDAFGRRLAERLAPTVPLTAIWAGGGDHAASSDHFVHARNVIASASGLDVEFETSWGSSRLRSQLIGDFNAENLAAVLAVLLLWEVPMSRAIAALEEARAPAGRMETFRAAGGPLAVVDYAHSPDALAKALRALRRHCHGQLWCVFGCGGDRDAGKRPIMGAIAAELADEIILTDDNPRTEDPQKIISAIAAGIPADQPRRVIRDRAAAIAEALAAAGPEDVVLIAGKGHEEYQIHGTQSQPFSDRSEVERWLGGPA